MRRPRLNLRGSVSVIVECHRHHQPVTRFRDGLDKARRSGVVIEKQALDVTSNGESLVPRLTDEQKLNRIQALLVKRDEPDPG